MTSRGENTKKPKYYNYRHNALLPVIRLNFQFLFIILYRSSSYNINHDYYQVNADLLKSGVGMVMKCHPGVAVVAVDHRHPVRLVLLKTISFVPLTASLINQRMRMYKSIESETIKVTYV